MFNTIRPVLSVSKRSVIPTVIHTVRTKILMNGSFRLIHSEADVVKINQKTNEADIESQLQKLLDKPSARLFRTVQRLGIPRDVSIIQIAHEKQNYREVLNKILKQYFSSPSVRELLIVEMAKLSHIDLQRARKIILTLYQWRKGKQWELWYPGENADINKFLQDNDTNLIKMIINIALVNNLTKVAYYTFMEHKELFKEDEQYQEEVLNSLILKNPTQDEYQLKYIVDFQKEFNIKFNQFQANQIMTKISEPSTTALVHKTIHQLVIENSPLRTEAFVNTVYDSITREVHNNNPEACAENWLKIRGYCNDITQHNFNILASLITIFTKNHKYRSLVEEIVTQLPSSAYGDPILVVPLLEFATEKRRSDLANAICIKIQPPISRRLLSSLLKLHIVFNDTTGTERIFQEINKTSEPLTKGDYHAIVRQLLRKNEFTRALVIVQSIPIQQSDSAYVAIINYIVDQAIKSKSEIPDKQLAIIDTLLTNKEKHNRHDMKFWERITGLYFKYLAQSQDLEKLNIVKQIYLNSTADLVAKKYLQTDYKNSKAQIPGLEITYNPFAVIQNPEKLYLKVSDSSKVILLKTIADGAIKLKDKQSLNFALSLLGGLGFSRDELITDFSRKYSIRVSRMGFAMTKSPRNNDIQNHQLNFMKKRSIS